MIWSAVLAFLKAWWRPLAVVALVAVAGLWHLQKVADAGDAGYRRGETETRNVMEAQIAAAVEAQRKANDVQRERDVQIARDNEEKHRVQIESAERDNADLLARLRRVRVFASSSTDCGAGEVRAAPGDAAAVRPPGSEPGGGSADLGGLAPIILDCKLDAIDYDGFHDWYQAMRQERLK